MAAHPPGRPFTEPVACRLPAAHADGLPDLPHRRRPAVIGDVTADATQDPLLGGSEAVDAARRSGRVTGVVEAAHHTRTARWARVAGARVVQRQAAGPPPQLGHQGDAVVYLFRPPARDVEQQTVQRTTDQFGVGTVWERWRRATCSASARSAAPVGHGSHSQSRSPGHQGQAVRAGLGLGGACGRRARCPQSRTWSSPHPPMRVDTWLAGLSVESATRHRSPSPSRGRGW